MAHIFYSDSFVLPLPEGHRFPMQKYAMLRHRIVASGLVQPSDLHVPHAATDTELRRAHSADYVARAQAGELSAAEIRNIGFPWSAQMIERSRRSSGATIEACRAALAGDIGINLAGGTHHAYSDHGEGFCVFNDSVAAARAMQAEGGAQHVLVFDCDVHQGNGTAQICTGDPTIFTCSIHAANNYPFEKEHSDLDVELEDGTDDVTYLEALETALTEVFNRFQPDLVIYLAGADPYINDKLGRLALTKHGLLRRDLLIHSTFSSRGIPLAVTMAGGYARNIEETVDIHFATVSMLIRF